ncbi:tRNA uridine-5-carboxymethylaminomethyl(34) synthesis GTPase MnmE [[Mycoplasma] mobile]|uniref:tRNA modification GTPase MnmE n=1 Tax=Mycoplasma mobile (strain ATCC 43663 / 163K / NCTC 11711) TaxID=267748 RepID=MNME_MYCM1|nr:tRNA uridine-5-carboxymethylaminomethyl(34) synthesis GTPase MnmE [[Mycoplasma] mobile]Q6KH82.1 RecName: Full=tRNA modification GTPase MnmE [Mycoplasma mobile 163K]AAT28048.1 thiophene and furan oxidation protein [Mycoplasma mobile 163K]
MFDTIAAIATGNSIQAISIIRISGSDSFKIVKKIFTGKIGKNKTITYGNILNHERKIVDEVLVAWFEGTNNFTGENSVEIFCHGGIVVTNLVLQLLIANGARLAERGEFSRRSFLNKKMDFVKAEAINDLIHAKTIRQAQISVNKFDGKISKDIESYIDTLLYLIATCETNIDYPEYDDVENLHNETLLPKIKELIQKLNDLIKISEKASIIYNGLKIAIVGKPNVGKSSLLNALLNEERAIVTNEAGTTRDVIEASFQIDGFLFSISDTAGLREVQNNIENLGIQKTFETIEKSDIILHIIQPNEAENDFDKQIEIKSKNKIYLKILNKKDLIKNHNKQNHMIKISTLNKDIIELENKLSSYCNDVEWDNPNLIYSQNQLSMIKKSYLALSEAKEGLESGLTPDVVIIDITKAWESLVNIKGKADNELLLDKMFSNFCLGK